MSGLRGRTVSAFVGVVLVLALLSAAPCVASGGHVANGGGPPDVDIDGDGRADLLIGSVEAVQVLYGDGARQRITAASLRRGSGFSGFGFRLVACDVNGDGFSDAVVGAASASVGRGHSAGRVVVLYGAASGLSPGRRSLLSQATPGVPGVSESNDNFGWTVACGHTAADRFDDIVIGVPGERFRPSSGRRGSFGRVVVVRGGAHGVVPARAWAFNQDSVGVPDRPEPFDGFGSAIEMGDVTGDGLDEVIAWSGELVAGDGVGALFVLPGQRARLRAGEGTVVYGRVRGDRTIYPSLVIGDFNGRGPDDVVVASWKSIPTRTGLPGIDGHVMMLRGTPSGLSRTGWRTIGRGTPGLPSMRPNNGMGRSLAAGDVDGDGDDDLLVSTTGLADSGRVLVLRGGPLGITTNGVQTFSQVSPYIPGKRHKKGQFGRCLELIDLDGDQRTEAVISSVEDIRFIVTPGPEPYVDGVGAVTILPATPAGLGADGATRLDPPDFGATTRAQGAGFGCDLAG